MANDPFEVKVYCKECNSYLWSIGRVELNSPETDTILIYCPMVKDPMGECTGKQPRLAHDRLR